MRLNIDLTQGKTLKNVYFTSDFHLFHHNVLKFDKRPFNDVHHMHQVIEQHWNETVNPDDIVIYLGDLSFARREDNDYVNNMLKRLKGKIHFVMGNHDKIDEIKKVPNLESIHDYLEVRITHMEGNKKVETLFCCMHYPIYSWNKKHHGSYMIHGHSHMGLSNSEHHNQNRIIDVGCMGYNYKPVSYIDIIKKLENIDYSLNNNHH